MDIQQKMKNAKVVEVYRRYMQEHVIPNIEAEDFTGDDGEEGKILSFKSCVKLVTVSLFFKERRMAPIKKKLREQRRK